MFFDDRRQFLHWHSSVEKRVRARHDENRRALDPAQKSRFSPIAFTAAALQSDIDGADPADGPMLLS